MTKMIKIPTNLVRSLNEVGLKITKHSPLILTSLGIAGLGATAYFSYKAAGKVEEITQDLEDRREEEAVLEATKAEYECTDYGNYEEEAEAMRQQIVDMEAAYNPINRFEVARDLAGAVALPVITGVISITCIFYSYRILTNRNTILATTLGAAITEHTRYKAQVRREVGDEVADRMETPTETVTVQRENAKGKMQDIDETTQTFRRTMTGEWFSVSDEYVSDDHFLNMAFIRSREEYLDLKLFRKGVLRLNEVNDALGFPRTKNGELMGWTVGNGFNMDTTITNINDDKGFARPEIYIKWTQPTYIYDSIDYGDEYYAGI